MKPYELIEDSEECMQLTGKVTDKGITVLIEKRPVRRSYNHISRKRDGFYKPS